MTKPASGKSSKEHGTGPADRRVPERPRQPAPTGGHGSVLTLQRSAGNHAVTQLLAGTVPAGTPQPKLIVGPPGDRFEQEADRVAEAVVRTPSPAAPRQGSDASPNVRQGGRPRDGHVSRQHLEEEEELLQSKPRPGQALRRRPIEEEEDMLQAKPQAGRLVQRQPLEEEEELLQAKEAPGQAPEVTPELADRIGAMKGRGQPLSASERSFFEPRFGRDFSHVRVHTDAEAAEVSGTLQARAFTVGRDIAFGAGEYAPDERSGKLLLAHELAHVVQQGGGGTTSPVAPGARSAASAVSSGGGPAHLVGPSAPRLARQEKPPSEEEDIPPLTPSKYRAAFFQNRKYATSPERNDIPPGWPYTASLRRKWNRTKRYWSVDDKGEIKVINDEKAIASARPFVDEVRKHQIQVMGFSPEKARGYLGPSTAASLLGRSGTPPPTKKAAKGKPAKPTSSFDAGRKAQDLKDALDKTRKQRLLAVSQFHKLRDGEVVKVVEAWQKKFPHEDLADLVEKRLDGTWAEAVRKRIANARHHERGKKESAELRDLEAKYEEKKQQAFKEEMAKPSSPLAEQLKAKYERLKENEKRGVEILLAYLHNTTEVKLGSMSLKTGRKYTWSEGMWFVGYESGNLLFIDGDLRTAQVPFSQREASRQAYLDALSKAAKSAEVWIPIGKFILTVGPLIMGAVIAAPALAAAEAKILAGGSAALGLGRAALATLRFAVTRYGMTTAAARFAATQAYYFYLSNALTINSAVLTGTELVLELSGAGEAPPVSVDDTISFAVRQSGPKGGLKIVDATVEAVEETGTERRLRVTVKRALEATDKQVAEELGSARRVIHVPKKSADRPKLGEGLPEGKPPRPALPGAAEPKWYDPDISPEKAYELYKKAKKGKPISYDKFLERHNKGQGFDPISSRFRKRLKHKPGLPKPPTMKEVLKELSLSKEAQAGVEAIRQLRPKDGEKKVVQIVQALGKNDQKVIDDVFKSVAQVKDAEGATHVIADLAAGGTKTQGALHVLHYTSRKLKDKVDAFEVTSVALKGGKSVRQYDVVSGGVRFEFKDWTAISEMSAKSARNQFARDIIQHAASGFKSIRWVFNPAVKGRKKQIEQLLLSAFDDERVVNALGKEGVKKAKRAFTKRMSAVIEFF